MAVSEKLQTISFQKHWLTADKSSVIQKKYIFWLYIVVNHLHVVEIFQNFNLYYVIDELNKKTDAK